MRPSFPAGPDHCEPRYPAADRCLLQLGGKSIAYHDLGMPLVNSKTLSLGQSATLTASQN